MFIIQNENENNDKIIENIAMLKIRKAIERYFVKTHNTRAFVKTKSHFVDLKKLFESS